MQAAVFVRACAYIIHQFVYGKKGLGLLETEWHVDRIVLKNNNNDCPLYLSYRL